MVCVGLEFIWPILIIARCALTSVTASVRRLRLSDVTRRPGEVNKTTRLSLGDAERKSTVFNQGYKPPYSRQLQTFTIDILKAKIYLWLQSK